ncbi:MAG: hypothetical protein A3J76_00505 [Candidatus Moranbacteria bacterium RBG_13_45_13]|nr:MAG: hypothetical protein A3J76_00505 [Candidatus Moranbacteria bacterium RBG_13_45_13]
MIGNNLLKKTGFFILAILIAAGQSFFVWAKTKKSVAPENNSHWRYEERQAVIKVNCDDCLSEIAEKYDVYLSPLGGEGNENFYLAKSLSRKSAKKLVKDLEKDGNIELVQPNFKYKPLARLARLDARLAGTWAKQARIAGDTYFSEEWWLFDVSSSPGGVSATSAWDLESKSQRDIAVAVIDSGANMKHKDLKKNLGKGSAKGKNFENPKRKPTDSDGHGSFLSGIIAARSSNHRGVTGASIDNNLKIMPLRFDFTTSQAIEALAHAKSKGVMVVNASWGSYGDEGLDLALKDAISQYPGVFVTASGNNGVNHESGNSDEKMYPCNFELANIVCVGASDQNGNLADYSDYGATLVDIAAPGGTDDYPLIGLADSKSEYTEAEGSSLSTAFVSAEAGLLFSKYPNLSGAQVIEIITSSVDTNASFAGKVKSGGKVNFQKALENAAAY